MTDPSAASGFELWLLPYCTMLSAEDMLGADMWAALDGIDGTSTNVGSPSQQIMPGTALDQRGTSSSSDGDFESLWPVPTHIEDLTARTETQTKVSQDDKKGDKKKAPSRSSLGHSQSPARTPCPTCGKTFGRKSDMLRHARGHNKQNSGMYRCPFPSCRGRLGYTRNDKLLDHLRARHKCEDVLGADADLET